MREDKEVAKILSQMNVEVMQDSLSTTWIFKYRNELSEEWCFSTIDVHSDRSLRPTELARAVQSLREEKKKKM